jgi:hypothetical protein
MNKAIPPQNLRGGEVLAFSSPSHGRWEVLATAPAKLSTYWLVICEVTFRDHRKPRTERLAIPIYATVKVK